MDENLEKKLLDVIERFWLKHGYPPTRRELVDLWGVASTCTVQARLAHLEKAGLVKWDNGKMVPVQMLKRVQEVMG